MKEKRIIFRCHCGHPAYVEFHKDVYGELWIATISEPSNFIHWLKQWFHRKIYHHEAVLYKRDIKRLKKWMEAV